MKEARTQRLHCSDCSRDSPGQSSKTQDSLSSDSQILSQGDRSSPAVASNGRAPRETQWSNAQKDAMYEWIKNRRQPEQGDPGLKQWEGNELWTEMRNYFRAHGSERTLNACRLYWKRHLKFFLA
jgi:hypothetical protein